MEFSYVRWLCCAFQARTWLHRDERRKRIVTRSLEHVVLPGVGRSRIKLRCLYVVKFEQIWFCKSVQGSQNLLTTAGVKISGIRPFQQCPPLESYAGGFRLIHNYVGCGAVLSMLVPVLQQSRRSVVVRVCSTQYFPSRCPAIMAETSQVLSIL